MSTDTAEVPSSPSAPDETDPEPNSAEEGTSSVEDEAAANGENESPPAPTLTDTQKKRIGPRLKRLIRGETSEPQPVGQRGQASIYEVILRCDDPDALRNADIPLSSVQGNVITARLSIDQILKAATVDAVGGIQAAQEYRMHDANPGGAQRQSGDDNQGGRQ